MPTLEINIPAGPHTLFTEEAAQSMIGQPFIAKNEDDPVGIGVVMDAHIIDDGRAIQAKIKWPEEIQ